jgi:hypothetical protein
MNALMRRNMAAYINIDKDRKGPDVRFCAAHNSKLIGGAECPECKGTITANKVDMVNQPPHYKHGGIETIDYLVAKLSPEEFAGYCRGNALKYISRAGHKADAAEDYRKAIWYLNRMIKG